jgi:hypothetical protein
MLYTLLANLQITHDYEEKLRRESLRLIAGDKELLKSFQTIERAMAMIYSYTVDYHAESDDEQTLQILGVRLFNAAASGVKLVLAGYYQTAFQQARDIMETSFLLDYFHTWPSYISVWKRSDRPTRRKYFDLSKIREALDERDGDVERERRVQYHRLSELTRHATFRAFATQEGFGEFGPYIEKKNLMAWAAEMAARLGPAALIYGSHFPAADAALIGSFQEFSAELAGSSKEEAGKRD